MGLDSNRGQTVAYPKRSTHTKPGRAEKSVDIPFPKEFEEFKEITVRRKVIEYGHDHWILFWHKASKPCHRMNVTVRCDPGLVIREFLTLGTNDGISVEFDDAKREQMSFRHNGWLDSGHGVAAVISAEGSH